MERSAVTYRAAVCLSLLVAQICSSTSQTSTLSASQESCVLPQSQEFGNYTAPICQFNNTTAECRQVPGTSVPQNWMLLFKCNEGYYFTETKEDNFYVFCINGKWTPNIPVCRMTRLNEVTYDQVNASQPSNSALGTSHTNTGNKTICGKRNITSHGSFTQYNEVPWYVVLYMKNASAHWSHMCSGTLISPHIVVTAAHCVYSERLKKILSPIDLKLGFGKYNREWTHEELSAIKSDVREILIPHRYLGLATSYSFDVALLDLPVSIQISEYIMPACVDWNHELKITRGMKGMLTGWSKTENGTPGDVLLYSELSYVGYRECIFAVPTHFQHYITPDKFCAGSEGTDQISRYSSGGGLTFVHNDLHYVHGIVSTTLTRAGTNFITLTNVTDEDILNWIIEAKRSLAEQHKEI